MRRSSGRYCPKCRVEMRGLLLENVEVDMCPRCLGTWFDARELSRASGLKVAETMAGAAGGRARRTEHRCPSCAIPLMEREIDKGTGICIDQCIQCAGIFLDRDEFSRIKEHYAAVGAPAIRHAEPPPPKPRPGPLTWAEDEDGTGSVLFQFLSGLPIELGMATAKFPWVTVGLIVVNTAVLIAMIIGGLERWIDILGLVPAEIVRGERLWTFLTAMFTHAGPIHLLGNMYFFYVAGDNLEERFGWWRYLLFYLLCGVVADVAFIAGEPHSPIVSVGASGAIAGLMGAYVVLWPRAIFLVRIFWFLWYHFKLHVPVWAYFALWLAFQSLCAIADVPGIAWWAHIGGFACGACIAAWIRWGSGRAGVENAPRPLGE
jgi:membrane associated rhomboid family serine protease/Zn-finger nucleic acid-binding protein